MLYESQPSQTKNEHKTQPRRQPEAVGPSQLVADLKASKPDSYEQLICQYGGYLMTIARRYLNNEADVQDIVQETFIQAFKSISRFEERASLKSWLHKITVNQALDRLRARSRRPEDLIDDVPSLFDDDGMRIEAEPEIGASIEKTVMDSEFKACVRRHIQSLPELPRSLLMLRDIEGYSTEETASMLNMSVPAVKTGLHRARKALKKALEQ